MVGRWVVSATCSGPFSSAIRRRASASTRPVKRAARRGRGALGVGDAVGPEGLGDLLDEPVRVEALEGLVGAPRREPRRPPGHRAEPGDGLDRQLLQAFLVAGLHRLGHLLAERGERGAGVLRAVRLVVRGRAALPDQGGEVEVEQRVEARPVGGPLHQRGGVRRPEGLALGEPEGADRGGGVDVLGERDRHAGGAQGLDEADVALGERHRRRHRRVRLSSRRPCRGRRRA